MTVGANAVSSRAIASGPPAALTIAMAQVTETDLAQAMTAAAGALTIAMAQVTETDLAQAVGVVPAGTVLIFSQATETDGALTISPLAVLVAGQIISFAADLTSIVIPADVTKITIAADLTAIVIPADATEITAAPDTTTIQLLH